MPNTLTSRITHALDSILSVTIMASFSASLVLMLTEVLGLV
jgi:hypothetical protein